MLAKRGWGSQHQQAREEGKGMQCGGVEETTRMSLARTASETLREQPGPLPRMEFTSPQPVLKNKGEGPPQKKVPQALRTIYLPSSNPLPSIKWVCGINPEVGLTVTS